MIRLFAAIKIKPEPKFLSRFDKLKQDLKHENIKWVEAHNLHLTLKFFGETSEAIVPEIMGALEVALKLQEQFSFNIWDIGIFGSRYMPKVIWAGLQDAESLIRLATSVNSRLEEIGFSQDRQNFVPHLSLGRIKSLGDKDLFQHIILGYKNEYFQNVFVKEIYLLASTLTREGPIYQIVERFGLK